MRHLLLILDGPMQAWGRHTYEDYRPVEVFPTRSGLVGLLAACFGIDRQEHNRLSDLAASFSFSVQVISKQGKKAIKITDFHTVLESLRAEGPVRRDPIVSKRQYLCDSVFAVALQQAEHGVYSLDEIYDAIQKPVYTPFLGRRSCPLSRPLFECWVEAQNSLEALEKYHSGASTIYSEEKIEGATCLRVRDVPIYGDSRMFSIRDLYVKGGGLLNVFD